jgi:putative oxidoreductase
MKKFFISTFLDYPDAIAAHFKWLAPLFSRLIVGWIFLWRGWSDLHSHLHLPNRDLVFLRVHLEPIFSCIELAGGLFLLLGFVSRLSAGALAVVMILLLALTRWSEVHSVDAFVGLKEAQFLALFLWLGVAGPGPMSVDTLIERPGGKG